MPRILNILIITAPTAKQSLTLSYLILRSGNHMLGIMDSWYLLLLYLTEIIIVSHSIDTDICNWYNRSNGGNNLPNSVNIVCFGIEGIYYTASHL